MDILVCVKAYTSTQTDQLILARRLQELVSAAPTTSRKTSHPLRSRDKVAMHQSYYNASRLLCSLPTGCAGSVSQKRSNCSVVKKTTKEISQLIKTGLSVDAESLWDTWQ